MFKGWIAETTRYQDTAIYHFLIILFFCTTNFLLCFIWWLPLSFFEDYTHHRFVHSSLVTVHFCTNNTSSISVLHHITIHLLWSYMSSGSTHPICIMFYDGVLISITHRPYPTDCTYPILVMVIESVISSLTHIYPTGRNDSLELMFAIFVPCNLSSCRV